jgi:dCMP deaminase
MTTSDVLYITNWDIRFLDLATHVSYWSRDPSTQVGAAIANDHKQVLSLGYNGFPRGVEDRKSRYEDRETKLLFTAHAERNALDNATVDVRGATLYSTLCPCNECAKSIIQRGIRRVVTNTPPQSKFERFNIATTLTMFRESGVELVLI